MAGKPLKVALFGFGENLFLFGKRLAQLDWPVVGICAAKGLISESESPLNIPVKTDKVLPEAQFSAKVCTMADQTVSEIGAIPPSPLDADFARQCQESVQGNHGRALVASLSLGCPVFLEAKELLERASIAVVQCSLKEFLTLYFKYESLFAKLESVLFLLSANTDLSFSEEYHRMVEANRRMSWIPDNVACIVEMPKRALEGDQLGEYERQRFKTITNAIRKFYFSDQCLEEARQNCISPEEFKLEIEYKLSSKVYGFGNTSVTGYLIPDSIPIYHIASSEKFLAIVCYNSFVIGGRENLLPLPVGFNGSDIESIPFCFRFVKGLKRSPKHMHSVFLALGLFSVMGYEMIVIPNKSSY